MKPLLLCLLLVLATPARAGLVTKYTHRASGTGVTENLTYQQGTFARSDTYESGGKSPVSSVIVDTVKEEFLLLRHKEKGYFRTTVAQITSALAQVRDSVKEMNAARGQMDEMMKHLPKEQQKQMRDAMAEATRAAKPPPPPSAPRKIGGPQRVGKWTCTRYEEKIGTDRSITCYATHGTFALTPEDIAFSKRMLAMVDKLTASLHETGPRQGFFPGRLELGIGVETVFYRGETILSRGELVSLEHKTVDESMFQIPAGYQDQSEKLFPAAAAAPKTPKKTK